MNKYLLSSFIIHLLFLFPLFLLNNNKINNDSFDNGNGINESQKINSTDVEIIEINEGEGKQVVPENFYWGIGIGSSATFENISPYGLVLVIIVTSIKKGYSAYDSDLQIGDKIILVNNNVISNQNDIKGDSPKSLILTLIRNNSIINIAIDRVKVYF